MRLAQDLDSPPTPTPPLASLLLSLGHITPRPNPAPPKRPQHPYLNSYKLASQDLISIEGGKLEFNTTSECLLSNDPVNGNPCL